jgi:hypothetical protein
VLAHWKSHRVAVGQVVDEISNDLVVDVCAPSTGVHSPVLNATASLRDTVTVLSVPRQQIEDLGRRRCRCFEYQIVALQTEFETGSASRLIASATLTASRSTLLFSAWIERGNLRPHRPHRPHQVESKPLQDVGRSSPRTLDSSADDQADEGGPHSSAPTA